MALLSFFIGPSIGDLRSRCVRLSENCLDSIYNSSTCDVESDEYDMFPKSVEMKVVKLLKHRLSCTSETKAQKEWFSILHQKHELWDGIKQDVGCIISTFLNHFQTHLIQNMRDNGTFSYKNGSIGNFFFSGARLFFNSLESAIFLFCRVLSVPNTSFVMPCVRGNMFLNIGVELEDGSEIRGQNNISHPSTEGNFVSKDHNEDLPSPIKRVFYFNSDNQVIKPDMNINAINHLKRKDSMIIYGMGSLFTSIIPSLILNGAGECISKSTSKKVLLLNGYNDRETKDMTALDFIKKITEALNRYGDLNNSPNCYITHLCYCKSTDIYVDKLAINKLGIKVIEVKDDGLKKYDLEELKKALQEISQEMI